MNARHPCFSLQAHERYGRMHLPVAPRCNVACGYCDRSFSCVNESRPGVTAAVLSPLEAVALARRAVMSVPRLTVAGIAGPGDPLANPEETFTTLHLVRKELPDLMLCLSTNGLALPEAIADIKDAGVGHVTVTVNAVDPAVSARIYSWVQGPETLLAGLEGASLLLARQEEGIRKLSACGVIVKVNCVVVPGVNDHHVGAVAQRTAQWGARLMNCIALIPVRGTPLGDCPEPGCELMSVVRRQAQAFLPQMRHCARCRADALGMLGDSTVLADMRSPAGQSATRGMTRGMTHVKQTVSA